MTRFEVSMHHSERSFELLSHMQYDLYCTRNRIARSILSIALILLGLRNSEAWWGFLFIAYACYLLTSTYSSANHTAHKLSKQILAAGDEFPSSLYTFDDKAMHILSLPDRHKACDPLYYDKIDRLGVDRNYYYIFPNSFGGYMIPKSELGEREAEFRDFIEARCGQMFRFRGFAFNRFKQRKHIQRLHGRFSSRPPRT